MDRYKLTPGEQAIIDDMVDGDLLIRHFPPSVNGKWNGKSSWWTLGNKSVNKMTCASLIHKKWIKILHEAEAEDLVGNLQHIYILL